MRIGIDIDGVLADVLNNWVKEMNLHFKQDKNRNDITDYRFEKVYNVSRVEMDKFFRRNQQILLSNLSPIENAKQVLDQFFQEHQVILITARPGEYQEITEQWLQEHKIYYHHIKFTNFQDKSIYVIEEKVDIFIEDSLDNAISIAKVGVPVLLFDAPYNQGKLPGLINRVYSWDEIYKIIKNNF